MICYMLCENVVAQTASMSLIEELQKTNSRLEDEVKVLRNSVELSTGATSLTDVIEAQERKIKVLEVAQQVKYFLTVLTVEICKSVVPLF